MDSFNIQCDETYKTGNCQNLLNPTNHEGTEVKYKAVEKYVEAWFEKTYHNYSGKFPKLAFNYIDIFAGSGLSYDNKNNVYVEGTIARVINVLMRKASVYPEVDINIYANDINEQFVKCLKCYCNNKKLTRLSNIVVDIKTCDYRDFVTQIDTKSLMSKSDEIANINLVYYDPYNIDFDWRILERLFSLSMTDIIINHIFPNDTKRALTRVTDTEKKANYERAYGKSFEELLQINTLPTTDEKDYAFRNLFHRKLKEISRKSYIGYAPVINDRGRHTHVFDLVVASNTNKACCILKDEMFKLYQDWENDNNREGDQISFDLGIEETISSNKKTEFNFRYDVNSIGNILASEFGGRSFDQEEFNKIFEDHEYLPTRCKQKLKDKGFYKIKNKKYIVTSLYIKE